MAWHGDKRLCNFSSIEKLRKLMMMIVIMYLWIYRAKQWSKVGWVNHNGKIFGILKIMQRACTSVFFLSTLILTASFYLLICEPNSSRLFTMSAHIPKPHCCLWWQFGETGLVLCRLNQHGVNTGSCSLSFNHWVWILNCKDSSHWNLCNQRDSRKTFPLIIHGPTRANGSKLSEISESVW